MVPSLSTQSLVAVRYLASAAGSPDRDFCLSRCFVLLPSQVGSGEILISAGHHIPLDLVGCARLADLVVEAGSLGVLWQAP